MNRTVVNALLNLAAAVLALAMLLTGIVLQFVLPPGTGGLWRLWSLERHDWALLHSDVSAVLLVVLVVHVALHWRWIAAVINKRLGERALSPQTLALAAGGGLVLVLVVFSAAAYATRSPRTAVVTAAEPAAALTAATSYARDIAPVLALRCIGCHDEQRARGGLQLHDYTAARTSAQPDAAGGVKLLTMLRAPKDATHTLDADTVRVFERWVSEGALP